MESWITVQLDKADQMLTPKQVGKFLNLTGDTVVLYAKRGWIRYREIRKILGAEMRRNVVHMLPRNCPDKTQSICTAFQLNR